MLVKKVFIPQHRLASVIFGQQLLFEFIKEIPPMHRFVSVQAVSESPIKLGRDFLIEYERIIDNTGQYLLWEI